MVTEDDHKNAEYVIDGKRIKLVNGVSEIEETPGSVSKLVTRYFGNEVKHDLNDDGREDIVFLLTQEGGGSGTFFYVVAALNTEEGFVGSQAFLLGDRIVPQSTRMGTNPNHKNVIVVNWADRAPGEPMTANPSVGKSVWLKLDSETLQFGEVVQNFEGEADPSRMTLPMKPWVWISAHYNDGREVFPKQEGKFTLTFSRGLSEEGRFSGTTDCNSLSGEYKIKQSAILFENIAQTKMYCEGSEESTFVQLLHDTVSYHFTSRGELIFDLKFDSGIVTFR